MAQEETITSLPGEIWKDVVGFEGLYLVSNLGRIKSTEKRIVVRLPDGGSYVRENKEHIKAQPLYGCRGYLGVSLYRDNVGKMFCSHRIVATAFLPNPENLSTVNHKNGIKSDNRVCNLEWMSYRDNNLHALHVLGKTNNHGKPVLCLETGAAFRSIEDASRKTGESVNSIRDHLRGRFCSLHGKHWKFISKEEYGRKQHCSTEAVQSVPR